MASTCVVGLQWGDEAKGKVVDFLTLHHDMVVRFNGGSNAGHTVAVGDKVYRLSLGPSGIVHPSLECVIGNGVVLHPPSLFREVKALEDQGLDVRDRLKISDRAHVILPYHLEWERLLEEAKGGAESIGTTRRGIGPCYADKMQRIHALRVGDLFDPVALRQRLESIVPHKNQLLRALSADAVQFDAATVAAEYSDYADRLKPYVCDAFWVLQRAMADGKRMLFEAAQGTLLDID
ncbi:MAG: adenylosuccinate synthetase, partial [Planctomycetia bacterium]